MAAATGGAGVQEQFSPYVEQWGLSKTLAHIVVLAMLVVPLTFVTIVFAELVPKMIALHNNEWVVLRLSPVMRILSQVAHPVVAVIEGTVKAVVNLLPHQSQAESGARSQWLHELRAAVSLARTSKLMGEREEKIVLSAAQMSTRPVRDIIIPAADMSMIYVGSTLMDALVQAHLDMHTRFPVCMTPNDPQSVETYVNFKDIVAAMRINPKDPSLKGNLPADPQGPGRYGPLDPAGDHDPAEDAHRPRRLQRTDRAGDGDIGRRDRGVGGRDRG